MTKGIICCLVLLFFSFTSQAQNGPRMNVAERMEREKTMVFDSIPDLNNDQKLLIEQVYTEVSGSVTSLMESGDRTVMREKMMEIQKNKQEAFRDIMTEEQFARYTRLMENARGRYRRGNQQDQ